MDVFEIRKRNLQHLIEQSSSAAAFARETGNNAAYISHVLSSMVRARMGDDVARRIEAAKGLEHGWMDVLHTSNSNGMDSFLAGLDEKTRDFVETAMLLYKANPDYGKRKIKEWLTDVLLGKLK